MSDNQTPNRFAPSQSAARRLTAAVVVAIAGGLGGMLPAGVAEAQLSAKVEAHEPYQIVITDERAMVRCGPGAAYYPVVEILPVGSILTTDGETTSGWLRVRYPENATALVSDESLDVRSDTQTGVLSRPATLSAFNVSTGARGSWSKLLAEPLDAGTQLVVVREAFNDLTGELVGYEVEPPAEARAFIRTSFTRRATSADLANAPDGATPAGTPAQQPTSANAAPVEAAAETEEVVQAESTPAPTVDTTPGREVAETPAEVDAALTPTGVQAVRPGARPRVGAAPARTTPAEPEGGVTAEPEAEPLAPMTIQNLEDLESAFAAVQAQPLSEAEFDQLLAEVERMIEAEPADSGVRPAIESRRNVLVIRKRVQDAWRANAEAAQKAESTAGEITSEIRRLQVERSYSAIGRLLPSAVYDGKRLPRMYRIQSVDTTEAPRTLGYIRPDSKLGLESKLNQTVGVVGTPRLDPRLNLLIIEPIKIDVIGAGG